ncbi:MAG: class II fumarate hydratase [SAR324 cluster bacterium]|jgi:fumarate hydratase class II|nr:class II fumarate hydratase [SAR324 cluster bacterium]MEE1576239.1 class II fumarate hydratase [Deltaproteobacteria bacterium]MDP6248691.1 class II fumarate hydratase [SAR324 cluster bacterium]MDP6728927.1 class II fumarate hydratase [SAR324 cluster bacterium]MDP7136965.1 class II fumarate hydratase [SAR324 cluster bacterium]|tara:strand:+ start:853 stop:2247 length:1395 start_codon:yes stop_codon:yes gene_type:complete
MTEAFRIEKDSMGEVKVPREALYAAQTQRAIENFPVSGIPIRRPLIAALGMIKCSAARVNGASGAIPEEVAFLIQSAAQEVIEGKHDEHFPIDIYQTGSGTSSNMNANEVIANRASQLSKDNAIKVHPNDHVNCGQSSNDTFPTAIRIAAVMETKSDLIPALVELRKAFLSKGAEYAHVVKTGRTHLMDAMPVTLEQEFSGYARQLELGIARLEASLERIRELPMGGTAVGTGINTPPEFPPAFAEEVSNLSGEPMREAQNHFEAQSTVDAPVEMSGQLKTIAVGLLKIVNDLRWMNSGPNAGLGEIQLAALQPGSSIMPGKVNPVIEESTAMVCAQVIGYDSAISVGGLSGNFELNVMLPMVAHSLLESIRLLAAACRNLAHRSVSRIIAREEHIQSLVGRNPILVTTLNPLIGYDLAAKIAKTAFAENRPLLEVAMEMCELPKEELIKALDPAKMTQGGLVE